MASNGFMRQASNGSCRQPAKWIRNHHCISNIQAPNIIFDQVHRYYGSTAKRKLTAPVIMRPEQSAGSCKHA